MEPQEVMATALRVVQSRHDQAWLAGGWVRDRLLGRETRDVDIVVPAGAVTTARALADAVDGAFVLLDMERDTARVLVGPPTAVIYLDLTGLRAPTIEADLLARDFTINAMAVPMARWAEVEAALIDPSGGRRDLDLRLIRAVSADSLRADPLRMLRAVRLAGALGFTVDSQTAAWAQRDAELLDSVSRERVRDELAFIVDLPQAADSLRLLDELRLLEQVLPEVARLQAVPQPGEERTNALAHSLETVEVVEALRRWLAGGALDTDWPHAVLAATLAAYRAELQEHLAEVLPGGRSAGALLSLAGLLHNIGRGAVQPEGTAPGRRLLEQDVLSASMAATAMRRLCFSGAEVVRVRLCVHSHTRPRQMVSEAGGRPSRRSMYRFYRDAEPSGVESVLLSLADHLAARGAGLDPEQWRRHLAASAALLDAYYRHRDEVIAPPPVVDGRELMSALELAPGPMVGGLLESIREAQAAGEVRTRAEALDLARELLAKGGPL